MEDARHLRAEQSAEWKFRLGRVLIVQRRSRRADIRYMNWMSLLCPQHPPTLALPLRAAGENKPTFHFYSRGGCGQGGRPLRGSQGICSLPSSCSEAGKGGSVPLLLLTNRPGKSGTHMMPSSPGSLGVSKDVRTGETDGKTQRGHEIYMEEVSLSSVHPALTGTSEVHFLELWISLEGPALRCGDKLIH